MPSMRHQGISKVGIIGAVFILGLVFFLYENYTAKKDSEAKRVAAEQIEVIRRTKADSQAKVAAEQKERVEAEATAKRSVEQKAKMELEAKKNKRLENLKQVKDTIQSRFGRLGFDSLKAVKDDGIAHSETYKVFGSNMSGTFISATTGVEVKADSVFDAICIDKANMVNVQFPKRYGGSNAVGVGKGRRVTCEKGISHVAILVSSSVSNRSGNYIDVEMESSGCDFAENFLAHKPVFFTGWIESVENGRIRNAGREIHS